IVGRRIEGYSSGDHRSRQADEDGQHCYSHPWRIALLERFWQARHPPRYAAYLIPSSPSFPLSSRMAKKGVEHDSLAVSTALSWHDLISVTDDHIGHGHAPQALVSRREALTIRIKVLLPRPSERIGFHLERT